MRFGPLLLMATTASMLAWSTPPTAIFVGRVISTAKVSDVSFQKNSSRGLERVVSTAGTNDVSTNAVPHLEIWKAEVQVQNIEWVRRDLMTNLAARVWIYYNQDSSTNFVTPYGIEANRAPRLRLIPDAVYEFYCNRLDIDPSETNAFRAFDGGINIRE